MFETQNWQLLFCNVEIGWSAITIHSCSSRGLAIFSLEETGGDSLRLGREWPRHGFLGRGKRDEDASREREREKEKVLGRREGFQRQPYILVVVIVVARSSRRQSSGRHVFFWMREKTRHKFVRYIREDILPLSPYSCYRPLENVTGIR